MGHVNLAELTKPELIDKVETARNIWRNDQTTMRQLQNNNDDLREQIGQLEATIAQQDERLADQSQLPLEAQTLDGDLKETLNTNSDRNERLEILIKEKDELIESIMQKIQEVAEATMDARCKMSNAYAILAPYHKITD